MQPTRTALGIPSLSVSLSLSPSLSLPLPLSVLISLPVFYLPLYLLPSLSPSLYLPLSPPALSLSLRISLSHYHYALRFPEHWAIKLVSRLGPQYSQYYTSIPRMPGTIILTTSPLRKMHISSPYRSNNARILQSFRAFFCFIFSRSSCVDEIMCGRRRIKTPFL